MTVLANEKIKEILQKLKEHLLQLYGYNLDSVILYGSYAKGKASKDSDLDVAIVFKDAINSSKIIKDLSDFIFEIVLDYGEFVSICPVAKQEIENSSWPFYLSLKEEGIRV